LETDLGEDLPAVRANPAQIRRVVMNLITNASEAIGDRDGVIQVTTGRVRVGRDSPLSFPERPAEGDYLQLQVSDTGRGMTAEMQARVFDPFFTTKLAGHGLGLAVVQGIVRSLDGTVHLVSAPGKGTMFQILLPCAEGAPKATRQPISRSGTENLSDRGVTILVADDQVQLLQATSKMLRKVGFSVIEASHGTAALDLIRSHKDRINVLLLDITLPGATSREVFEEARRLKPDMKVIVISANSEDMAAAALGRRGERFLRKPFKLGELIDMIREVLSS